jgi:hypothetical protein
VAKSKAKRKVYEVWGVRFIPLCCSRSRRIRWRKGWVKVTVSRYRAFKSCGYRTRVNGVEDKMKP